MNNAFKIGPVLHIIGLLLTTLGAAMLLPAIADAVYGNPDWKVFIDSSVLTGFVGITMILTSRGSEIDLNVRQAFLLTTASWIAVVTFAALPFIISPFHMSTTDAYFEAMSGLTTTGSTVITGLDSGPPGILLWRALLQWLGGIGIIVMAIALLPALRVGGMQLFKMESSETSDKAMPRIAKMAMAILIVYVALTATCGVALFLAGMGGFEAMVHAMTTLSTGGFSTSDASIAHFANPAVEWIIVVFMVAGSIPFILYVQTLKGHSSALTGNSQVRTFAWFLVGVVLLTTFWVWTVDHYPLPEAFRYATFSVVSVVTTTGFATTDYTAWGGFAVAIFLFLTVMGGCTGSTSGGIKIFRFEILGKALRAHLWRLVYPNGVRAMMYGGRGLHEDVFGAVLLFVGAFAMTTAVSAVTLAWIGLDPITSISAAATAMANVGPGLGDVIGPTGNFASLPDSAKWVLVVTMLLGRLEIFSVLVLVTPTFWRG
ncbi:MAG: TrkH family potassium uptake protein [Rhodospirillales bacterium]|nr:TrkH family potassium uptake protein [Rhodospirillales bacterium]MCW8861394.1 TrkH family potassium uptake protein [Rhodospirillales bacterium]MCW8952562.1 TrkH family potassium uptake protein [Rhodospirillales bacterium]MCW8971191.1 TrkH family potassium uptake protein [Rhodospirillales bacterium]MCW9002743.1 TrkH family potassium uptake protein [Rhodospirillales bacterium]